MATTSYYQKSFSIVPLSILLTFFLFQLNTVNSAKTTSFEFTDFKGEAYQSLLFQGDAVTTLGVLRLNDEYQGIPVYHSVGRALYGVPIRIWEKDTGAVASFQTNFSFVINAVNETKTADGLAFFLAPVNYRFIHENGGLLGIFDNLPSIDSNQSIVAVEFDTYDNDWDPKGHHIGINVKSIKSKETTQWNLVNRNPANVSINYDGLTSVLTASLVDPSGSKYTVKHRVDLTDVLPEWVSVGFSATTGDTIDHIETHNIHSWSFRCELPDKNKAFKETNFLSSYVQEA